MAREVNKDIDMLIGQLDWNLPVNIQQKAMEELTNEITEDNIEMLIQPLGKQYWENSAKVIRKVGYPKNYKAIAGLLCWLQDMNWPGAWISLECLQNIDYQVLSPFVEAAMKEALNKNDEMWIEALKQLSS
jgi:hypothetical protein